jgi:small subunit ribosomal protein S6e
LVKVIVSDPESGRSYQLESDEAHSRRLVGLRVGDKFDGEVVGLLGYELEITGGTDQDGFPMRRDVSGPRRARVLLARGPGFRSRRKGERRRKLVRGGTVSDATAQLNAKVVKKGGKSLEEILGTKEVEEEAPEEKPPEKEEKPPEEKPKEEKPPEKEEKPPEEKPKEEKPPEKEEKPEKKSEEKPPEKEEKPKEEPKGEAKPEKKEEKAEEKPPEKKEKPEGEKETSESGETSEKEK